SWRRRAGLPAVTAAFPSRPPDTLPPPPMGRDPSSEPPVEELSFEEAERRLLACPEVAVLGLLPNSSNYTFLARVSGPGGEILAVYKPARGESPLWDFPSGPLHRREG